MISSLVTEGLSYLDTRSDFWRQQKPMYARRHDRHRQRRRPEASASKFSPNDYIIKELERIDQGKAVWHYALDTLLADIIFSFYTHNFESIAKAYCTVRRAYEPNIWRAVWASIVIFGIQPEYEAYMTWLIFKQILYLIVRVMPFFWPLHYYQLVLYEQIIWGLLELGLWYLLYSSGVLWRWHGWLLSKFHTWLIEWCLFLDFSHFT